MSDSEHPFVLPFALYRDYYRTKSMIKPFFHDDPLKFSFERTKFYAISPSLPIVPPGTYLFEIETLPSGKSGKVKIAYDPFHKEKNAVRFSAWLSPVPESIPLFVYSCDSESTYLTFDEKEIPQKGNTAMFPVIYVLPRETNFSLNYGNVIPSISGENLAIVLKNLKEPNLLAYLEKSSQKKFLVWIYFGVIATLFLFFILSKKKFD